MVSSSLMLVSSDDRPIRGSVGAGGSRYRPGDKVEVLKKGTKWFPGEIVRERQDGSFDVRYDDGDSETGVHPDSIRMKGGGCAHGGYDGGGSGGPELREGTKVEARYKGKEKFYPGVIRRVNADGSFNIDYNDV
jgi:hypothetical protein